MPFNYDGIKGMADRKRQRVVGVIEEEMRLYPDQPDFRLALAGLTRLYVSEIKSPMAQSLAHHASLAHLALALAGRREPPRGRLPLENDFLSGEMLALHAETKPVERELRQYVLNKKLELVIPDDNPEVTQGQIAESFLSRMDDPIGTAYEYFPPDLAQATVDASIRYDGSIDGESRELFLAGYLHATNLQSVALQNMIYYPKSYS